MALKKKIELYVNANTDKEFHSILNKNKDRLICAEIYNDFSGPCTALDRLFTIVKLDWSDNKIILLRALADDIEVLKRFRGKSEPVYVFIHRNKITKLFRGVNTIKMADIAKKELEYHRRVMAGEELQRQTFDLDEATPEELLEISPGADAKLAKLDSCDIAPIQFRFGAIRNVIYVQVDGNIAEWEEQIKEEVVKEAKSLEAIRAEQRALRKRRRAELMVPHLQNLNFVLFWPHCKHAHFELYERWDANNIIMVGREEIQLDEYKARDILYAGDAPINEASMHALLSAPALAICFRCLDDDVHFTSLVRKILYEYIAPLDPAKPASDQPIQKTAYNYYKSFSLTREEILRQRREDRQRQKEEAIEKRARRLSEMQRLARQAIEEVLEGRRLAKEQQKLHLLKIGDVARVKVLEEEPDDEEVDIVVPEELSDEEEDFDADVIEDEDEYFPPPGLLIPGFYAPPSDVAKTNGLAILFPRLVLERVTPEPEFLPPHVIVMLEVNKRYKTIEALTPHRKAIIHMGIFQGTGPFDAQHIAYSVAQYNEIKNKYDEDSVLIAFMLSIESDQPILALMDLYPKHVSRDACAGELEAIALFPVRYCDDREFEDFRSKE